MTLLLVRSDDRRMIIAELKADRAAQVSLTSPFFDALRLREWDLSTDEAERATAAIGRQVASVRALIWRPSDLANDTIRQTLR